jgi:hypothetical protein
VKERDPLADQAELLGRLAARLNALPRDEFGENYSLAVSAAYRRAVAVVVEELRRVCASEH